MSELVVISFDDEADAARALARLRDLEKVRQIHLEDTAVVAKDSSGKVNVKNEWSSGTEIGAVVGGAIGSLASFMFPVAGTVAGAAAGGWLGSKIREGVDGKFVDEVSASLEPGKSALFLIVQTWNPDAFTASLVGLQGQVLHTSLSTEFVDALHQALK